MDSRFAGLTHIRHSDNLCSVGWTCIHAIAWDESSMAAAKKMCPKGSFSATFVRRSEGGTSYYFNFPLDMDAAKFMVAIDLTSKLLKLRAGGGRHKWPEKVRS